MTRSLRTAPQSVRQPRQPRAGISFGGVDGANNGLLTRMTSLEIAAATSSTNDSLVNAGVRGKILDTGWEWDANLSNRRRIRTTKHLRLLCCAASYTAALEPSYRTARSRLRAWRRTPSRAAYPLDIFEANDPSQVNALTGGID